MKALIVVFFLGFFAVAADAAWTDTVKMKGDFRFRNELITDESISGSDSEIFRQRIRLRVGVYAEVNKEVSITSRIATGSTGVGGITSANETLEGYSSKKDIILDLAYFEWNAADNLQVVGGKIPVPFQMVGGSDLYYDSDLTLEGMALQYNKGTDEKGYKINLGYSWLDEVASTATPKNSDALLLGAQITAARKIGELGALFSVAHYAFTNLEGRVPIAVKGNTLDGAGYANDFYLMVYGVEITKNIKNKPVIFFAELVENTKASQEETATIYGVKFGDTKEKKDWSFSVDYRDIGADGVLGVYSDSDFADGETNSKGFRVAAYYKPGEKVVIGAAHIMSEFDIPSAEGYTRSMLDFIFAW